MEDSRKSSVNAMFESTEIIIIENPGIAAILCAVLIYTIWRKPILGLTLLLAAPQFLMNISFRMPFANALIYTAYVAAACFLVKTAILQKNTRLARITNHPMVVLYMAHWALIIGVFLLLRSEEGGTGISRIRHFLLFEIIPIIGILALSGLNFFPAKLFRNIFATLFITQSIFFLVVLRAVAQNFSVFKIRFFTFFGIPLFTAGSVLFVACSAALLFSPTSSKKQRNWGILGLGLGLILATFSQSRSVMTGSIFVICITLFQVRRHLKIGGLIRASLASVVLILALKFTPAGFFVQEAVSQRLEQSFTGDMVTKSSGRVDLWRQAIDSFLTSPIIGVGIGNATQPVYDRGRLGSYAAAYRPGVHHFLLATLAESGLIGIILVTCFGILASWAILPVSIHQIRSAHLRTPWLMLKSAFMFSLCNTFFGGPDYLFWTSILALVVRRQDFLLNQREKQRQKSQNLLEAS